MQVYHFLPKIFFLLTLTSGRKSRLSQLRLTKAQGTSVTLGKCVYCVVYHVKLGLGEAVKEKILRLICQLQNYGCQLKIYLIG